LTAPTAARLQKVKVQDAGTSFLRKEQDEIFAVSEPFWVSFRLEQSHKLSGNWEPGRETKAAFPSRRFSLMDRSF
jgi:hypothetical protein